MKEFSVVMGLVDYIPVILFTYGCSIVIRDIKEKMSTPAYVAFVSGTALVAVAGMLKATYKLLYALGITGFVWMSDQFFANQSIGFLIAGIGILAHVFKKYSKKKKTKAYSFIPTMGLVALMLIGVSAIDLSLAYLASKKKKTSAIVCLFVSFILTLMMGYLSSRDFDKAAMNWIAQFTNIFAQGFFCWGISILHKAGLKDL